MAEKNIFLQFLLKNLQKQISYNTKIYGS